MKDNKYKKSKRNYLNKVLSTLGNDMEKIGKDLESIFISSEEFEKLQKIVNVVREKYGDVDNNSFLNSFSVFANTVLSWYIAYISVGIRRHLKVKDKDNSLSLYKLLKSLRDHIKENKFCVSKEYFKSSFYHMDKSEKVTSWNSNLTPEEKKVAEASARKSVEESKRKQMEKDWSELVGEDRDYLSWKDVDRDLKELKEYGKTIETFADKYIAHYDKDRKNLHLLLNLDEFAKALEKIKKILNKYSKLLGVHSGYISPRQTYTELFYEEFKKWLEAEISEGVTRK